MSLIRSYFVLERIYTPNDDCCSPLETMEILVKVRDDLVLNARKVSVQPDEYVIIPPEMTLFDQLWNWLALHPRKDYGIRNYALGIGVTA